MTTGGWYTVTLLHCYTGTRELEQELEPPLSLNMALTLRRVLAQEIAIAAAPDVAKLIILRPVMQKQIFLAGGTNQNLAPSPEKLCG